MNGKKKRIVNSLKPGKNSSNFRSRIVKIRSQ